MPAKLGLKFFTLVFILILSGQTGRSQSLPLSLIMPANYQTADNHQDLKHDTLSRKPSPVFTDSSGVFSQAADRLAQGNAINQQQEPDTSAARQQGSGVILDQQVDYSAEDSIFFDVRNQKVYLYGNSVLNYGDIHLESAFVEIDFRKNEVYAKGMPDSLGFMQGLPVFTEGEQSFQSEEMRYNFESRKGRTIGVITEEADGFLHGNVVKIQPNREIHAFQGKFTTCNNPDPHFHIGFRKAKIIPGDKIVTSLAYLVIEGVPLPLVVPFGYFPNKKGQASGVLFPTFSESAQRGFGLERGGFYWGINDYIDLALRGDIYSRGSWATSLESTYRMRYRYSGNFSVSYSVNVQGEQGLPSYEKRNDFRIIWNHAQDPKARPNSSFRASVNAGSSNFTRFNPVSDQEYLSNTFSSSISYNANWAGGYNFSASLRHSQNTLSKRVDLSLPEIAFGVARFNPFRRKEVTGDLRWYENINVTYNMNARNQISVPDSLLFEKEVLNRMRNGVNHVIPVSHTFRLLNHLNVSTSFNYQERWYFSTISREWDPRATLIQGNDTIFGMVVTDTVPGFKAARDFNLSTSINTRIYGLLQFRKGAVRALRHVITPNISFSFRPDFADPFWGYYQQYYNPELDQTIQYSIFEGGLYGTPQANRSGNISLSLSNNIEMKVRSRRDTADGERKITIFDNLTLSGGYDVARDSLNFSDIRLSGRTRLFSGLDITFSSSWTVYDTDSLGRRIDRFLWETEGKPFQMNNSSASFSFNYSLNSKAHATPAAGTDRMLGSDVADINGDDFDQDGLPDTFAPPGQPPFEGIDLAVPWNLALTYSFNYGRTYVPNEDRFRQNLTQIIGVNGTVNLTSKWRIGFRSGFDFNQKEITYTSVNIYRDLHCWEMLLDWIPFGFRRSYSLTIRVKSSVLQDLKLTRRTSHLDRQLLDF